MPQTAHLDSLEDSFEQLRLTLLSSGHVKTDVSGQPVLRGGVGWTIFTWDFAADLSPEYLDHRSTRIEVVVWLDATLKDKIDAGTYGLTWQRFRDAAKAVIDKYDAQMKPTIRDVDAKIDTLYTAAGSGVDLEAAIALFDQAQDKTREANEVLEHTAKQAAAEAEQAIAKLWQAQQVRESDLTWFKVKVGVKLFFYGLSATLSTLSAVVTGGAAALVSVIGIAKIIADASLLIAQYADPADQTRAELDETMETLRDRIGKEMGAAASAEQFFRDLLTTTSAFSGEFVASIDRAKSHRALYANKLAQLEVLADENTKKINTLLDKVRLLEAQPAFSSDAAKTAKVAALAKEVETLLTWTGKIGANVDGNLTWADGVQAEIDGWQACRGVVSRAPASKAGTAARITAGLVAATKTVVQLASAL